MIIPQRCKVIEVKKLKSTKSSKKCQYSKQQICHCCKYLGMMEAIPTFTLPNQFLLWVVKKVFVQSDLDLILNEYYKKRVQSQLKNRKTHTNGLILTESTYLTRLQIPTDLTPYIKPSSTKRSLFLLSPPFFPLFLPLNIAPLLFISPITFFSLS